MRSTSRPRGVLGSRGIGSVVSVVIVMGAVFPVASAHAYYSRPGSTERASVANDGSHAAGSAARPAVSGDGRFVAFESRASNLAPGVDTHNEEQIYVRDLVSGTTEIVSISTEGNAANDWVSSADISADGRFVVFDTMATNLVPQEVRFQQVYLHDRETGTTELVSRAPDGTPAARTSWKPAVSGDGRYVAFQSYASNLVPGTTPERIHIYLVDRTTGNVELISRAPNGDEGNNVSVEPAITPDGRYVSYHSLSTNLVEGPVGPLYDVFVHDRDTGETEYASVASDGTPQDRAAFDSSMSADGRYVTFHSNARNLAPANSYDTYHVYVRDLVADTTERVSVSSAGVEGSGSSMDPSISADGRFVTFMSFAFNLIPEEDLNQRPDIYVYDRELKMTEKVTVAADGGAADMDSLLPDISHDGGVVVFESFADNLVPNDTNRSREIFLRDRGPATGIGILEVTRDAEAITAQGAASFSGAVISQADSPSSATDAATDRLDAGIGHAGVIYRTEREDLLFRTELAALSSDVILLNNQGRSVTARPPTIVYGWSFDAGGASWELRAQRLAPTADPSTVPWDHAAKLFRCQPDCEPVADLPAGVGTAGSEVRAALPLDAVGIEPGDTLSNVRAFAAPGELTAGYATAVREMSLPDAVLPEPTLAVGIAPEGDTDDEVAFEKDASLDRGTFSGAIDISGLPAGTYEVWARACLGDRCGAASRPIVLEGSDVVDAVATVLELTIEGKGANRILSARLSNEDMPSEGIGGRTVDFYADGDLIGSVTTDDEGVATLHAPPRYRGGKHDFEARFEGGDNYLASSDRWQT